jgi:hypothetical protein
VSFVGSFVGDVSQRWTCRLRETGLGRIVLSALHAQLPPSIGCLGVCHSCCTDVVFRLHVVRGDGKTHGRWKSCMPPHLFASVAPPPQHPSANTSTTTSFRLPFLNTTDAGSVRRVQTRHPTIMWSHHGSDTPAIQGTQLMQMRKKFHVPSPQSSLDLAILPSPD